MNQAVVTALLISGAGPTALGAICACAFGWRYSGLKKTGLLFHSVKPHPSPGLSCVSTGTFEGIARILHERSWSSLCVRDLPSAPPASAATAMTFDDGYESIYAHALPVLEKYRLRATIFPVASFLGRKASWDVFSCEHHLTVEHLREIAGYGHEIGSHTLTHANLPFLDDRELDRELHDSKHMIEDITGTQVTSISFPHGNWNRRVWERALRHGYTSGTIYRGHTRARDRLVPVYGAYRFDSPSDLAARIGTETLSLSRATGRITSHFAKGTPIWKFRSGYDPLRHIR